MTRSTDTHELDYYQPLLYTLLFSTSSTLADGHAGKYYIIEVAINWKT